MVHDLFLVFSVFVVGFYALWGSGFVKHDIFICRIFAGLMPYLCSLFPLFSFGCDNDFYVGKNTERRKEIQAISPFPGLSGSRLVQRSQKMSGSGHKQYFLGTRVVLGSFEDNLATILALFPDHACPGWREGYEMWPENSPSSHRAQWPNVSFSSFSTISIPLGLGLSTTVELGWVTKPQRLCLFFCSSWVWKGSWSLIPATSVVAVLPGLALPSIKSNTSCEVSWDA